MSRITELKNTALQFGVYVDTWSPGDGVTRYRFSRDGHGYFACKPLYTALGLKEAELYIRAYGQGFWGAKSTPAD